MEGFEHIHAAADDEGRAALRKGGSEEFFVAVAQ